MNKEILDDIAYKMSGVFKYCAEIELNPHEAAYAILVLAIGLNEIITFDHEHLRKVMELAVTDAIDINKLLKESENE